MSEPTVGQVGAIIAAGGSGVRLAEATGGLRKQFASLGGAPIFIQTLRCFLDCERVGPIVIVFPQDELESGRRAIQDVGHAGRVELCVGGGSRQASVAQGLAAIGDACEFVLVHDAVRPFVSQRLIGDVIEAVVRTGAAAPAIPIADTLRRIKGESLAQWVDRDGLYGMQTPQAARVEWLRQAHEASGADGATDEVGALQAAGFQVELVEGDEWNRKVTRPADLELAHALWPAWSRRREK